MKEAFSNQSFLKLWGRNTIFKCTPPSPSPPTPLPQKADALVQCSTVACSGESTVSAWAPPRSPAASAPMPGLQVVFAHCSPPSSHLRDHCVWGEGGIRSGTQMLWVLVTFLSAVCTASLSCSLPSGLRSSVRETRDWSGSGNAGGVASLWGLDRSARVTHPECGSGMKRQVCYLTSHLD